MVSSFPSPTTFQSAVTRLDNTPISVHTGRGFSMRSFLALRFWDFPMLRHIHRMKGGELYALRLLNTVLNNILFILHGHKKQNSRVRY